MAYSSAFSEPIPQPGMSSGGPPTGTTTKKTKTFTVGDLVHFAVQDPQRASAPMRHGSIVLYVDGDRALLASSPGIPNVKVMDFGTEKIGMTWVKTAFLGKGHKNCQTTLSMSMEAAWNLRGKILIAMTGDVNETIALRGRGSPSVTDSQISDTRDESSQGTPSGVRSPHYGAPNQRMQDQELHAMVRNALVGFDPGMSSPSLLTGREQSQNSTSEGFSKPDAPHTTSLPSAWSEHHGSNPTVANELRALISAAFDEGIQSFQAEQKNMEKWVAGLQQQLQKVTGTFLVSFGGKLESEMDRRLTLYGEAVRNSCSALDGARGKVGNDTPQVRAIGASAYQLPSAGENGLNREITPVTELDPDTKGNGYDASVETHASTMSAISVPRCEKMSFHLAMLDKLEEHKKREQLFRDRIHSKCECYNTDCAPKFLVTLTHSNPFNNFCALATIVFAVAVGVESDMNITSALDSKNTPEWISTVVDAFNGWFVLEVALRMIADGADYFIGPEWCWNVFDFLLVCLSIVDFLASTGAIGFVRILRAMKILKAFRIVRLLRLFHDLRLLLASMLSSLSALIWSLMVLLVVNYIFAVMVIQGAVTYIDEKSRTDSTAKGVEEYFQSVLDAMYTLTACILGGLPWTKAAKPVWSFGWIYGCAFLFFVLFNLLGILNVIKGIFVERAANMKKHDKDYAISEELRSMETEIQETTNLFKSMDLTGSGEIAVEDLEQFLRQDRVVAHFASIGIDVSDREYITRSLSEGGTGTVSVKAFVTGCIALRGPARQSDTLHIVLAMKKLQRALEHVQEDLRKLRKLRHPERRDRHSQGDSSFMQRLSDGSQDKDVGQTTM